jgi:4-carboxymuconolactone decarboxylase
VRNPDEDKGAQLKAVAPQLGDYTDRLLYGEVWERPGLSARDRSLITLAALVALYRPDELPAQLGLGLDNGLTREEIGEMLTHLAFYAGWPSANSAAYAFKALLEERDRPSSDNAPTGEG